MDDAFTLQDVQDYTCHLCGGRVSERKLAIMEWPELLLIRLHPRTSDAGSSLEEAYKDSRVQDIPINGMNLMKYSAIVQDDQLPITYDLVGAIQHVLSKKRTPHFIR